MKIVLYQPQIPQNTGNIIRTCAVTGSSLILVPPLGFSISAKALKRAGLDYFEGVDVEMEEDLEKVILRHMPRVFFFTSKTTQSFYTIEYAPEDLLVFGSESHGLPDWVHDRYAKHCVRIPMVEGARCLNLATSVGIAVYQAYSNFPLALR